MLFRYLCSAPISIFKFTKIGKKFVILRNVFKKIARLKFISLMLLNCEINEPSTKDDFKNKDSLKEKAFISILQKRNIDHEIKSRIITPSVNTNNPFEINIYDYDFNEVEEAHQKIQNLDTQKTLELLFRNLTKDLPNEEHERKWLLVYDFVTRIMRHPPLTQPIYPDKSMITHPLILLYLGEGRCGHVARIIVDIALANGYEARLVQLAAHIVAEVKWDCSWHFIDVDSDFPPKDIESIFVSGIPSISELANQPYIIDKLPNRGHQWDEHDKRATTKFKLPHAMFYPADLTLSSNYFGEQIFKNLFSGDKSRPRKGLMYFYKNGDKDSWQNDKGYGWKNPKLEEQVIPMIPVEFAPSRIKILALDIIYKENSHVNVPIYFLQPKIISIKGNDIFSVLINNEILEYEVRVSRETRGWDYDYRNYKYMPNYGKGNLKVFKIIDKLNNDIINTHFTLDDFQGDIFVEVIPKIKKFHERDSFVWPSYEAQIQIFPEKYSKWNYDISE